MINLSQEDRIQIKKKGLSAEDIEWQLENFKQGFPPVDLIRAATAGDGIKQLEQNEIEELETYFTRKLADYYLMKFVPASGAASRMFKFLFEFLDNPKKNEEEVKRFIHHIKDFAFFNDLKDALDDKGIDIDKEIEKADYKIIIEELLYLEGLNYSNLPKALIKFHNYPDHSRTPLEEHLVESARYATNVGNSCLLHFTISPEHKDIFIQRLEKVKDRYAQQFNMKYKVEHSFQKESTDMIAVDMNDDFIREQDGSLLFRPGGHGALLENLNEIDASLIFIKNVDNVVPDRLKHTTNEYKRALAGLLIKIQKQVFEYLRLFEKEDQLDNAKLKEISDFIENTLSVKSPDYLNKNDRHSLIKYLRDTLNRPIRVCGMVKNQGEPGGGPFWVKSKSGQVSLQIVEMSQIDTENQKQMKIVKNSTHFNPVDLVCGVKDYKGRSFDLKKFRDPSTGIITKKTKDGKELKAQELPGLWNGGMAFWNTIFVEVPLITFTPVKTVNDLLRKEHQ